MNFEFFFKRLYEMWILENNAECTWLSFETIRKFFLPRCLEDVVEEDDDEVVLALVASNPNFAAAAAITAWEAAEVAAASLKTAAASGSNWNSFWGSGLELELKDSELPLELLVGKGFIDLGAAVGGIWCLVSSR